MNANDFITRNDLNEKVELLQSLLKEVVATIDKKNGNLPTETYLKAKDVRKLLGGISDNTLRDKRDAGLIPYTEIGGLILYPKEKILAILDKNMINRSSSEIK